METPERYELRALELAQEFVALRWGAIPIIFGFALLSTHVLGMSFQITPVYVLCCIMACINIYFTVHISMLSRQASLHHGIASIRRLQSILLNNAINEIRGNASKVFVALPVLIFKLLTTVYLMVLETIKMSRFNLFSTANIMHAQAAADLLVIMFLVRYTGSSESPLIFLSVIPIILVGSVMGFSKGAIYASALSGSYLLLSLLVYFKIIRHIKFYGPQFGDLSTSMGWAVASFITIFVVLLGTAYLADKLISIFRERIAFLQDLLNRSRRDNVAQLHVANYVASAWFITDVNGNILKYKRDRNGLLGADLEGKNLLEAVPALKQYGLAYVMQNVLSGRQIRNIERIRIQSAEGISHAFHCKVIPLSGADAEPLLLIIADDITETAFLKEQVEELTHELESTHAELEKSVLENKELNRQLIETLKQVNEQSSEVEELKRQIAMLSSAQKRFDEETAALNAELACVKSSNDTLTTELTYKQMILEELMELLKNCIHLDPLVTTIERRVKSLFKLEEACLYIFKSQSCKDRINEILTTQKASPHLLEIPRNDAKILEPLLNEAKAVIVEADSDTANKHDDRNKSVKHMIAYIPIQFSSNVIGVLMLDRFGSDENPDQMLNLLTNYISHAAVALKNAILSHDLELRTKSLTATIASLENNIASIIDMLRKLPEPGELPFKNFLVTIGKLCNASDASLFRLNHDGALQPMGRLDSTRKPAMSVSEDAALRSVLANPTQKTVYKDQEDSCIWAYPLSQNGKLVGVLFVNARHVTPSSVSMLDLSAKIASDYLNLLILNEEKELWENFYRENLVA